MTSSFASVSSSLIQQPFQEFVNFVKTPVPSLSSRGNLLPVPLHNLPQNQEYFSSAALLAHCLNLLSVSKSVPKEQLSQQLSRSELEWVENTNKAEQERLQALANKVVTAFIKQEPSDAPFMAEAVTLASVLQQETFRKLLEHVINGIPPVKSLDVHYLDSLAKLIRNAPDGYLEADDLANIVTQIGTSLQALDFSNTTENDYRLTRAVADVLDAMAEARVEGLEQKNLQQLLAKYLERLLDSNDPYLVYQAAYAQQALYYACNNESLWEMTTRQAGKLAEGASGLFSAVLTFNLEQFLEKLKQIDRETGVSDLLNQASGTRKSNRCQTAHELSLTV